MDNYGVGFADGLELRRGLLHQPAGWFAMTRGQGQTGAAWRADETQVRVAGGASTSPTAWDGAWARDGASPSGARRYGSWRGTRAHRDAPLRSWTGVGAGGGRIVMRPYGQNSRKKQRHAGGMASACVSSFQKSTRITRRTLPGAHCSARIARRALLKAHCSERIALGSKRGAGMLCAFVNADPLAFGVFRKIRSRRLNHRFLYASALHCELEILPAPVLVPGSSAHPQPVIAVIGEV